MLCLRCKNMTESKFVPASLRFISLLVCVLLSACDSADRLPASPGALVGTRAFIKMHGQDVVAEVTRIEDKLVTTEFRDWRGGVIREVSLYRGLFPVSGIDQGLRYETTIDESVLEDIFPLKVGKTTGVKGTMFYVDGGQSADFWTHIEVVGEKTIDLKGGAARTLVIEMDWEFEWNGVTRRKKDIIYFDPEHSMVLKSVVRADDYQNYWVVFSIEEPKRPDAPSNRPQQRRSGTVMI